MNKAVSDYMRNMQRRSAESRWGGLSAAERSAKMKAIRAAAKKEPFTIKTRMNKAGPTFIATLYRDGTSIGEFEKADRIEAQRAATALALELHALPPPSLLTGDDCACGTHHTA